MNTRTRTQAQTHINTHRHTHNYTHTQTQTQTHTHTLSHTHIHTHTQRNKEELPTKRIYSHTHTPSNCSGTTSTWTKTDIYAIKQETNHLPCLMVVTQPVLGHRQTDKQTCYQTTDRPPTLFDCGDTASAGTQTDR